MTMDHCEDCTWWLGPREGHKHAQCECSKLKDGLRPEHDDGARDAEGCTGIYTGAKFGCIHWLPDTEQNAGG